MSAETPTPLPEEPTEAPHNPVADIRATLRDLHSRYLRSLLLVYGLATAIGMIVVVWTPSQPERDWPFFLAMYTVIAAYIFLYVKAHLKVRRVVRFLSLVTSEVLIAFWCWVLVDRMPPQKVYVDGVVTVRGELELLWIPVALLCVVAVALVVHWAWIGRFHDREDRGQAANPAGPGRTERDQASA